MQNKQKEIVSINVSKLSDEELLKTMSSLKNEKTFYTKYKGVRIRSRWNEKRNAFAFCLLDICKAIKGIKDHKAAKGYAQSLKWNMELGGVDRDKLVFQTRLLASEGGMHLTDCVDRSGWKFVEHYLKYGKNGLKKLFELDFDTEKPNIPEKKEEVKPVTRDKEVKDIPPHIEEIFSYILNYLDK